MLLAACGTADDSASPVSPEPLSVQSTALGTNTFPPLKYNGATLRFRHFGLEAGLSQSSALAILQDQQGFLWIGTQDGLNRFDGYSFTVFRPKQGDPTTLSSGEILSLAQGTDGSIWIGTNNGLNRYDPKTGIFTRWLHDDADPGSLVNDTVQSLYQDPDGQLWVGTHSGLDEFDPASGKFTRFYMLDKPAGSGKVDSINALYEDSQRTLWIGTNDGLVRYGLAARRFQRYQNETGEMKGISFDEVASISQDRSGVLWVGTHIGLDRLDPTTSAFTPYVHSDEIPGSLADNYVQSTTVDRAGQLWVGTRSGLDRLDTARQVFVHYQNDANDPFSISSNTINFVFEDRGGNLWVGTNDGGLNEQDRSQDRFAYYHHVNGDDSSLSGDVVFPILPAADGRLWIGTYDAGLNLFDPTTGRSEHFRHDPANPESLLNDTVLALLVDKDHKLWIGTHQGLDMLYPASSKFIHFVNQQKDIFSIPFGPVYALYQDPQFTIYVGTAHGVRILNPTSGRFNRLLVNGADTAALDDGAVMTIYQDRGGALWFGTDSHGLFRFDPKTRQLKQYQNIPGVKNSLSNNSVLNVSQDSRGILWVSTFGGGLNRYIPEQDGFLAYRQEQGLPNDVVYGTVEDRSGALWMSTNLGISRMDVGTGSFENFSVEDGLQSNEFDSSGFARDLNGRLYFGGIRGLTVFDPKDIQKNPYVPPLVITGLTTQDGKPLHPAPTAESVDQATITYPQNSFDLSFAALSFSQIEKNQYKYMLEGFDHNWHSTGSEHRGSYTNLPGGTYTLRVIGSNSDGIWNNSGAAVGIRVVPPFWQTWMFRSIAALVLLVAATFTYRSRVNGIQAQKTELEQLVQDRTRALEKQNVEMQALYSADEKMLRVLSQDEILHALVDVAVDTLKADKSAVFLQTPPSDEYAAQMARGFQADTILSPEFSSGQQNILCAVAAGEALMIADTQTDPTWQRQPNVLVEQMAGEGVRSLLYIPIKVQDTVLGVFNICSAAPGAFGEDRQRLFSSLVQRAALSIENSKLFERTKHIAALEERNRLAQELHDSAKQKAFAALAQLGAAKKLASNAQGNPTEHLVEAENIVSEVIHDLTFFIQESYPNALRTRPLAAAVQEDGRAWEARSGIRLYISVIGERRLPAATEEVLYRIVQEGLANIARHSQATRARIEVMYREHEINIQIADNGSGFDRARIADGLGLRLIRERLDRIGGELEINSRNGRGTVLTIRAPL